MPSWHKVAQLVSLCDQRKNRALLEIARLERARREQTEAEALLDQQIMEIEGLLALHMAQTGLMDKVALFEARRRLAVLQRQKIDIRLERAQAMRQRDDLVEQSEAQRRQLLAVEKKRGSYQTWIKKQRRQAAQRRALLEQAEIEERTPWGKS